jgi:hypothetical protein
MRSNTKSSHRRRTTLCVESLEGKTLLSSGGLMHHVAPQVTAAPLITQATAAFSGRLTGRYSNVHAPHFAYIQSFLTSGTLTGTGSTKLVGTLFVRPSAPAGHFTGQLVMRNNGGSMILNVFASGTPGTYTYKVAVAFGSDSAFKGSTGTLTTALSPTFTAPYYSQGNATLTFA